MDGYTGTHLERCTRRADMAEALRSGLTIDAVMKLYRVSKTTVVTACEENGVEPTGRMPRLPSPAFCVVLANLQNTDDSLAAIADRLGCDPSWVSQIQKRAIDGGLLFDRWAGESDGGSAAGIVKRF